MASQKERQEFIRLLSEHTPTLGYFEVRQVAEAIMRNGATYKRIQEFECNAPDARYGQDEYNKRCQERWTASRERLAKKEEKLVERVKKLAASIQAQAIFQGDPRGATIKIKPTDGYTNDWGREGICVPTS